MSVPIVFIHYGNSSYLKYTIRSARKSNPEKRIILLGDMSNANLKKFGIDHYCFKDYEDSDELKTFDKNFKIIAPIGYTQYAIANDKTYWTSFVFRRLFIISRFTYAFGIDQFWT